MCFAEKEWKNYEYERTFETLEEAQDVASYFKDVLWDIPDFQEFNIMLTRSANTVNLLEFKESKTHVHVVEEDGHPVLEIFHAN